MKKVKTLILGLGNMGMLYDYNSKKIFHTQVI